MSELTSSGVLCVEDVFAGYQRDVDILQGLSLTAEKERVTVVVGPNGAGKSTLLKAIFGLLNPHAGSIQYSNKEILGKPPFERKGSGIAYIPQGLNIFPHMTVEENLKMGAWSLRRKPRELRERMEQMYDFFPVLRERRRTLAGSLSGGQARMVSTAKELILRPSLMLVDEPTVGVSPAISEQIYEFLLQSRQRLGASILLVDQRIEDAVAVADYVYVLNLGRVHASGTREHMSSSRIKSLITECLLG